MCELIKRLGMEYILHIITFLQLAVVVQMFLKGRFSYFKNAAYSLVIILGIDALLILSNVKTDYSIVINFVMIFILYKGEVIYKILVIINALIFIMTSEDLAGLFGEMLNFNMKPKIILPIMSLIIIITIVSMITYSFNGIRKNKEYAEIPKMEIVSLILVDSFSVLGYVLGALLYSGEVEMKSNGRCYGIFIAVILFLNIGILIIINKERQNYYYREVNKVTKKELAYYKSLERNNIEIRAIKHDMLNHLMSIGALIKQNNLEEGMRYIEQFCKEINDTIRIVDTGNAIVSAIINEKYKVAKGNNINMQIDALLPKALNIEMIDLCSLISNSIDNALEASIKIEDLTKRKINIFITVNQGYFLLNVTNAVSEEVQIKNNNIKTTKSNFREHGFGISNIKRVVEKYQGECKLECKDYIFKLQVAVNIK